MFYILSSAKYTIYIRKKVVYSLNMDEKPEKRGKKVPKNMSFRPDDFALLLDAAGVEGLPLETFIRRAALREARAVLKEELPRS